MSRTKRAILAAVGGAFLGGTCLLAFAVLAASPYSIPLAPLCATVWLGTVSGGVVGAWLAWGDDD